MADTAEPEKQKRVRGGRRANKFYSKLSEQELQQAGVDWDPAAALARGQQAPRKRVERSRSQRERKAPLNTRRERQAPSDARPAEGVRERRAPSPKSERKAPSKPKQRARSHSAFTQLAELEGAPQANIRDSSPARSKPRQPVDLEELIQFYWDRKAQIESEGLGHQGPVETRKSRRRRSRAQKALDFQPDQPAEESEARPSSQPQKRKQLKWKPVQRSASVEAQPRRHPSEDPEVPEQKEQKEQKAAKATLKAAPKPPTKPPAAPPDRLQRAATQANDIAHIRKKLQEATTFDEVRALEAQLVLITEAQDKRRSLAASGAKQRSSSTPPVIIRHPNVPPGMPGIEPPPKAEKRKTRTPSTPPPSDPPAVKEQESKKDELIYIRGGTVLKAYDHCKPVTSGEEESDDSYRQGMPSPSPSYVDIAKKSPQPTGSQASKPPLPMVQGCIDFHKTVDIGAGGQIPPWLIRDLQNFQRNNPGVSLTLLTYAGMFTTTSEETIAYVQNLERTYGRIFNGGLVSLNKRTGRAHWDRHLQDWTTDGKAAWMADNNKCFLIDDNSEICSEAEQYGLRTYRIVTHSERHRGFRQFAHVGQALRDIERQLKSDRSYFYVDPVEPAGDRTRRRRR